VLAQQRQAERVDRAPGDALGAVFERMLQPDGNLFGRPVRERDRADALGGHAERVDEVVDTGDEAERLPSARSRDDEDGAQRRFNSQALLGKRVEGHAGI